MSQPGEAGGGLARVDAVVLFEVPDPGALLDYACAYRADSDGLDPYLD